MLLLGQNYGFSDSKKKKKNAEQVHKYWDACGITTPRENSHLLIWQPVCYDAFKVYILSVCVFPDDLSIVSATSYATGMQIKTTWGYL